MNFTTEILMDEYKNNKEKFYEDFFEIYDSLSDESKREFIAYLKKRKEAKHTIWYSYLKNKMATSFWYTYLLLFECYATK